jgi:hypothetical protein
LLEKCLDCRKYIANRNKVRIVNKKKEAKEKNKFFCTNCHKTLPNEERAKNKDGTDSIHCHKCKELDKKRSKSIRDNYIDVKYQKALEIGSSCQHCKSVYIYEDNSLTKLETKEREKGQTLKYKGKRYYVKDFLVEFKHILELDILQLDHMTEEEQRELGLLEEDDEFIPKKDMVAKLSSRASMDLEARKCQLLCCFCHLIETIRREVGFAYNSKSYHEREKLEYLKPIKDKGCVSCGYINIDLPRFFHFDHLDPEEKSESIARMVKDKEYTLKDVKREVKKCRLLCNFCHILHTRQQRLEGTVSNQPRGSTKLKKKIKEDSEDS